jgi:hypothetical protein
MKKLIIISIVLLPILIACKKENNIPDTGTIIAYDLRECACCGGWFIEINDSTYRFLQLPANSNLDLQNAAFPVKVELSWQKDPAGCLKDEILIFEIRKK